MASISNSCTSNVMARVPATCGELVQGPFGGRLLQITCPIELRTVASASVLAEGPSSREDQRRAAGLRLHTVRTWSGDFRKTRRAIAETIRRRGGKSPPLSIKLRSTAVPGKGMASSSADILAGAAAASASLGIALSPGELADIALSVEPTDGIMIPGIALFDHREGRVRETLGPPPPMRVLVVDTGGGVDSLAFNHSSSVRWSAAEMRSWARAFRLVIDGIRTGDPEAIGRGATLSANLHQSVLPKPHLPELARLIRRWGGLGVNAAHSGTVVGLIVPDDDHLADAVRERVGGRFPRLRYLGSHGIVGGGVQVDGIEDTRA